MSEYTHTLIPHYRDLVPTPDQVVRFLLALSGVHALPLEPSMTVGLLSGETRLAINPMTQQPISYSRRAIKQVSSISDLSHTIQGHSDYNITVLGIGPPPTPALQFNFDGAYQFQVNLCLRPTLVSTSDLHDAASSDQDIPDFGLPCGPEHSVGMYQHPGTLAMILVPGGGCARFWIEFEFGKSIFPTISDSLEIMEPKIVLAASQHFGRKFHQGCHWSA